MDNRKVHLEYFYMEPAMQLTVKLRPQLHNQLNVKIAHATVRARKPASSEKKIYSMHACASNSPMLLAKYGLLLTLVFARSDANSQDEHVTIT